MTDKELVEKFEGLRLHAYPDPAGQTVRYAIGYGYNSPEITKDTVWTFQQADQKLDEVLAQRRALVAANVTVPLGDNRRAALVSLAYNIPVAVEGSTLIRLLNSGDAQGAADQFLVWDKVERGGKLVTDENLLARRKLEREVFLSGFQNLSDLRPQPIETKPVGQAQVPVRVSVGVGGIVNPVTKLMASKNLTKVLASAVTVATALLQDPAIRAQIVAALHSHQALASLVAGIAGLAALLHDPNPKAAQ